MKETIEVEIRSFLAEDKYDELMDYFKANAKQLSRDTQETYYLDAKEDLRIQRNDFGTKLWLKKGNLHDDFREEYEVNFGKDDFENIETIFKILGYKTKIKWFRTRTEFDWDGIKVDLDYTRGYGHIIELEMKSDDRGKNKTHAILEKAFNTLGIEKSSKEEFEKRYIDYENNWENITAV